MARKIGDVAFGVIILVFLLTGFGLFFSQADNLIDLGSSLSTDLSDIGSDVSSRSDGMEDELTDETDQISSISSTSSIGLEVRGDQTSGILNRNSKSVLTSFFSSVNDKFPFLDSSIFKLIVSLLTLVISILAIRFFWGESRV